MAFVPGDLVLETTTTTGTGTLTLAGAVTGYLTFSAEIGEGNTCAYSIEASNGQKETGVGTVVGGTLERTTLKASSTGSKLDLPAGTHYVGGTANSESFTPAAIGAATAAQGDLADSAVQPGDLGTAAPLDVGTDALDVVQLDADAKLPAVDGSQLINLPGGVTDHGALSGLTDDDHTNYALLAGRAGGQTLYGGTAESNTLTLAGSSNATSGTINASPSVTITGGTVTASAPALNITQTWNNAAVKFEGIRFDITDTASTGTANALIINRGGAEVLAVRKDGKVNAAAGLTYYGQVADNNSRIALQAAATPYGLRLPSDGAVGWSADTTWYGTLDSFLYRGAANTLYQRNGANAQSWWLANTYTDASNYERLSIGWSGNVCTIAPEAAGTGTLRSLKIGSDLGIGVAPASAGLHVVKTTEQLRLGYDADNYASLTVSSAGELTIAATGGVVVSGLSGSTQSFGTISVSGQSNVVADAAPDTLTLVAGSNITITTDAGADSITIASDIYTDEQAQDAVGGILTDSPTIDLTYDDAGGSITAAARFPLYTPAIAAGELVVDLNSNAVSYHNVSLDADISSAGITVSELPSTSVIRAHIRFTQATPEGTTYDVPIGAWSAFGSGVTWDTDWHVYTDTQPSIAVLESVDGGVNWRAYANAPDLALLPTDVDDTPVNGVTTAPVSSNWAYDHAALTTAHGISIFGASLVDDADAGTARTTLGLGTAAVAASGDFAAASHNQAETTITFTDVATGNASTTAHGFSPKATAPAAGIINVLAIANGETVRSDKALLDDTNPAALGTAGPGTATVAARRDHVHTLPKIDDLAAADDNTDLNASTTTHGLAPKAVAPDAAQLNVVGIAVGETAYSNKALFDALTPAALGVAAAGSSTVAAHRDHVHAMPSAGDVGAAAATSFIAGAGALTGPAAPLTIGTAAGAATGDFAAASHAHGNITAAGGCRARCRRARS